MYGFVKQYRVHLCLVLTFVGIVLVVQPVYWPALLQMDPAICGIMMTQFVGVAAVTAAIIMAHLSAGKDYRKYVMEAFAFASIASVFVILPNLQYANWVLDGALICGIGIFLGCGWWFFKQTDI